MPERLTELLLKAVRQLPQDEQDEVLGALLGSALTGGAPPGNPPPDGFPAGPAPVVRAGTIPAMDPPPVDMPPGLWAGRIEIGRAVDWAVRTQPIGTLDSLGSTVPGENDTALKVLPVRLPVTDYDRLRAFSREHGFSMAVIIRTLVERFLDSQAPRTPPGAGPSATPPPATPPPATPPPAD
jgi:hypothetical protein